MSLKYQNLIPLTDRVIIEPLRGPEKVGSIVIPELARDKGTQGIVVAAGPGRVSEYGVLIPMTVKVGDEVVYSEYTASKIKVDGQEVAMIRENEINCIVRK